MRDPFTAPPYFNPAIGTLAIVLPLPPADNQLVRSGRFGRYATEDYRTWLEIARERVQAVLGDWQPDTERWWQVVGILRLGARDKDAANHLKATLDMLSGAYAPRKDVKDAAGKVLAKAGVITRPGLFWDDDCRAVVGLWTVEFTHHPEPELWLNVSELRLRPRDWRELERARAAEAKAAAAAAERAARTVERPYWAWVPLLEQLKGNEFGGARKAIKDALRGVEGEPDVAVTFSAGQWARLPEEVREATP